MTMNGDLRDPIPPDWGEGRAWISLETDEEEDRAGPSDYVRREWIAGMRRRKEVGRECEAVADNEEDGDVWANGEQGNSLGRCSRRRTLHSPSGVSQNSGLTTVEEVNEGIPIHPFGDRRRRGSRSPLRIPHLPSLLPLFLLPILPIASAAPPLARQTPLSRSPPPLPRTTPPPSLTQQPIARDVQYLTSAAPPSSLPAEVQMVDETVLPYIMSQRPDGYWTKVDDGWRLYGRQSGESPVFAPDAPDSTQTSTWAVEQALPPGWGVQSTRTDFYRVPLIVVASCIIAIGIVVTIIVIAFKRRKAQRRAKRRAERQRRKALAAAGLTEESVNDSRNQEQLREKLDDLQRQHRAKKKGDAAVVSSPSARSKVRSWRAGLRRRRGGKGDDEGGGAGVIVEEKPEDGVQSGERNSADTDRSTPTVPSVEPEERDSSDGLGSNQNTTSSDEPSSSEPNSTTESPNQPGPAEPTTTTPYFPPAYRPASVRSLHIHQAGSSSTAGSSASAQPSVIQPDLPSAAEKVRAPGYYPAPATAEGEIALAIASRSDGKSRMPPPLDVDDGEGRESGEHTAHVATDDKRVLERMRMAASAPPQAETGEGEDGPSAPHVEVDESGFERMELEPPIMLTSENHQATSSSTPRPPAITHPSLPAPPPKRPSFNRSYSVEREVHEQLDELNLLPSAPPRVPLSRRTTAETPSTPPINSVETMIPSAPPLLPEEGEEDDEERSTPTAPTAPPLPSPEEDDVSEVVDSEETASERLSGNTDTRNEVPTALEVEDSSRRPSEAPSEPRAFLPRYEP